MSYVEGKVQELKGQGIFVAEQVDPETIARIINIPEWEFYTLEIPMLESYLGLLTQQIYFIQQKTNEAQARAIELNNQFKICALPEVLGSKIRSVEERWIFASTLSDELNQKFNAWQNAEIDFTLMKHLSDPLIERLLIIKKIYDERRYDGTNKVAHKYGEAKD